MIWKCNLCNPPCLLSMDTKPVPKCLSVHKHGVIAEWVPVEGIILSEVPA
ncbi:hypothetical protein KAW18_18120 [candidate division WOR-3 bacterium]|nr:hypothetical protein [candidate division WOR-3 bacterium]